ncbi:MAG TPA: hypothetical protein VF529_19520 [Solirubrobacteraceae bacterium]|jgi:hypothetical protein
MTRKPSLAKNRPSPASSACSPLASIDHLRTSGGTSSSEGTRPLFAASTRGVEGTSCAAAGDAGTSTARTLSTVTARSSTGSGYPLAVVGSRTCSG